MTTGSMAIRVVRAVAATPAEIKVGLRAWLTLEIDGILRIEYVTLRQTRDRRSVLAFPRLLTRRGDPMEPVRPIDRAGRTHIEAEVLRQLGIDRDTQQNFPAHSHSIPGPDRHPDLRGES